jgi:multiple sugar transport system permease protein
MTPPSDRSRHPRRRLTAVTIYGLLLAYTVWSLFPVLWVGLTSVKNNRQALETPPSLIFEPVLANYPGVFDRVEDLPSVIFNSILIAAGGTFVIIVLALPAAYGLSRFVHSRRRIIGVAILSTRAFPPIAIAIPLFLLIQAAGFIDTPQAVILANVSFSMPFAIWMFYGFIESLSIDVEEAARIDGASRLTILTRIIFPLILPGIGATAILVSIVAWREFLYPLVLTSRDARTLPVVVGEFITEFGINWGELCAFAMITIVPLMIFSVFASKYLIQGFSGSAAK